MLEALAYRRHVGATLGDIRAYAGIREKTKRPLKGTLAVLRQLADEGTVVKVGKKWFLRPGRVPRVGIEGLKPTWSSDDSLILLALLISGRERPESRLEDVVAAADYINHANERTFEGAVGTYLGRGK